jgi:hypothetical protein
MKLLTKEIETILRANAATPGDHVPALKLFNPCGAATWLVTELADDGDTLFGLADMGFGCPELGSFSLSEIAATRLRFGLKIERDAHFTARAPLSVYAQAARYAQRIVNHPALLAQAAQRAKQEA